MKKLLGTKKIETLLPPPKQNTPIDPGVENAGALRMEIPKAFYFQNHDAHIEAHGAFLRSRMVQINPKVYALLQAHISEHLSFKARAQVFLHLQQERPELLKLQETDPEAFQAETESMIARQIADLTSVLISQEAGSSKPDPVIALKQRELDLRAMDDNAKREQEQEKINLNKSKQLMGQQQFDEKLQQNEELAELRAETSLEKTQMGIDAKMVNDMMKQTDVRILKGPKR